MTCKLMSRLDTQWVASPILVQKLDLFPSEIIQQVEARTLAGVRSKCVIHALGLATLAGRPAGAPTASARPSNTGTGQFSRFGTVLAGGAPPKAHVGEKRADAGGRGVSTRL